MNIPRTRAEALRRLEEFLPHADAYSRDRNHVIAGHANVSRLSSALRTRAVLETEVIDAAVRACGDTAEKFIQEVYWRLYWKGWL